MTDLEPDYRPKVLRGTAGMPGGNGLPQYGVGAGEPDEMRCGPGGAFSAVEREMRNLLDEQPSLRLPRSLQQLPREEDPLDRFTQFVETLPGPDLRQLCRELSSLPHYKKEQWPQPMELAELFMDWAHQRRNPPTNHEDEPAPGA